MRPDGTYEPFAQTWTGIAMQLLILAWLCVVAWGFFTGRLVWLR
jgi:hypothetical protein